MRITRIEIENFRSIRHVVIDLSDTTVLVGPNNAGKTAILDALLCCAPSPVRDGIANHAPRQHREAFATSF